MRAKDTIWCDRCGVEITVAPYIVKGHDYCCQDCFNGFACQCGERMEQDEHRTSGTPELPGFGEGGAQFFA